MLVEQDNTQAQRCETVPSRGAGCRQPAGAAAMADVFRLRCDSNGAAWGSSRRLRRQLRQPYQRFDARRIFRPRPQRVCDDPRARCGEVLTAAVTVHQCPLFAAPAIAKRLWRA
ncbi:hypothetical protein LAD77_29925 [Klebsiella pneumoniae]|nr:hypothetical protein [Klebsiella pneumoniae]